jgi:uncharacterized protein DUF1264
MQHYTSSRKRQTARRLAGPIVTGVAAGVATAAGVIFDRNAPDARLIGIEYIISEQRFRGLPDDEKRLWHSHHHEVKSGILVAPGIPDLAEHAYFSDLVTTYGKTFHTW